MPMQAKPVSIFNLQDNLQHERSNGKNQLSHLKRRA